MVLGVQHLSGHNGLFASQRIIDHCRAREASTVGLASLGSRCLYLTSTILSQLALLLDDHPKVRQGFLSITIRTVVRVA